METKYFNCKLLSDVVLNAQTATEGSPECLDYIPGSNFLGMIAYKMYEDLGADKAFDVLHSGKVRFCDARISKYNSVSYKVPAAWFTPKGLKPGDTEDGVPATRIHHKIEDWDSITKKGIQLKQARKGYFFPNGELIDVELNYNQKSAHDKDKRRSKDSAMFGYQSIEQGSEFIFRVEFDNKTYVDTVVKSLEESKRLGRSKTAQYGLVEIKNIDKPENIIHPLLQKGDSKQIADNKELVIYAESDLCFFDEYGEPTLQPKSEHFGLNKACKIDWEKTQILTRSYAPWNGKRKTREADRFVISKGSVIVIQNAQGTKSLRPGVGYYQAEGLGQVIYNPVFLEAKRADGKLNLQLNESSGSIDDFIAINYNGSDIDPISSFLKSRKQRETNKILIHDMVGVFIKEHANSFTNKKPTSSQWGGVRSRASEANTKDDLEKSLFEIIPENRATNTKEQKKGYLVHGKSEWKGKQLAAIKTIFQDGFELDNTLIPTFVERLAAQMQKECQKAQKGSNDEQ